jgi:hypothetical protein
MFDEKHTRIKTAIRSDSRWRGFSTYATLLNYFRAKTPEAIKKLNEALSAAIRDGAVLCSESKRIYGGRKVYHLTVANDDDLLEGNMKPWEIMEPWEPPK